MSLCVYNAEGVKTEARRREVYEERWKVSVERSVAGFWFDADSVCNWFAFFMLFCFLFLLFKICFWRFG